jgi:mannose-6-phosphate isomerase-like protein (cupin superfamily)
MNVQEYIDSGILYDYCTGALSATQQAEVDRICAAWPEVQEELAGLQATIGSYAQRAAVSPGPVLQEKIWTSLDNINRENTGDIASLPVINRFSDYKNWKRMVIPFMPAELTKDRIITTIRQSDGVTQMLIISKTDVEEETHVHEHESFIILEGECECHVGDKIIRLGPGGFLEIPLHARHNVRVLSPYVVAVLQHVAV